MSILVAGVTTIDMTGIEALFELRRLLELKGVKVLFLLPNKIHVME